MFQQTLVLQNRYENVATGPGKKPMLEMAAVIVTQANELSACFLIEYLTGTKRQREVARPGLGWQSKVQREVRFPLSLVELGYQVDVACASIYAMRQPKDYGDVGEILRTVGVTSVEAGGGEELTSRADSPIVRSAHQSRPDAARLFATYRYRSHLCWPCQVACPTVRHLATSRDESSGVLAFARRAAAAAPSVLGNPRTSCGLIQSPFGA